MKSIFYIFLLLLTGQAFGQGEWVSASIDNGTTANSTALFIQSNSEFDANKCDNIVFTARIPKTAGASVTISESFHSASFSHITFAIQKLNVDDGNFYYYLINGTGTVQAASGFIVPINTPQKIVELTYAGGTSGLVQLVNIENDIPGNNFIRPQFYIQINQGDITNVTSMFYGTGGAVPFNNQPVTGDDWVSTANLVALPVKFLSFTATKKADNAELVWVADNENALTDRYEIERSLNGIDFTKTGTVAAKNNGNTRNTYTSLDMHISALRNAGAIYYRIKQIDRDAKTAYTDIRFVRTDGKNAGISVYPNPVVTNATVNIDLVEETKINLVLVDAAGKEVQKISINGVKGLNQYKLNMARLAAGTYIINVHAGDMITSLPVVKSGK